MLEEREISALEEKNNNNNNANKRPDCVGEGK